MTTKPNRKNRIKIQNQSAVLTKASIDDFEFIKFLDFPAPQKEFKEGEMREKLELQELKVPKINRLVGNINYASEGLIQETKWLDEIAN